MPTEVLNLVKGENAETYFIPSDIPWYSTITGVFSLHIAELSALASRAKLEKNPEHWIGFSIQTPSY